LSVPEGLERLQGKDDQEARTMNAWLYLICVLVAVLGRIVGQSLGAKKELANRRRQYRLERLADAWRSIQLAASAVTEASRRGLHGALRDVQLFGTPSQVNEAARVVQALDAGDDVALVLVDLLEALRAELRREMHLSGEVIPLASLVGEPAPKARSHAPVTVAMPPRRRLGGSGHLRVVGTTSSSEAAIV
jgi:hypothetical protein